MKDNFDINARSLRKRDDETSETYIRQENHRSNGNSRNGFPANGHSSSPSGIDFWVILDLLLARWHWLVLGALCCGGLFFAMGWRVVKPKFTATAQLQRFEPPGVSENLKTPPLSAETFASLIRAPDLMSAVG